MKRYILIIVTLLSCLALRAQAVTYTCRYWFDQNDAQAVTTTFSASVWQAELDVGTLSKGLHTLHIQAADTSWCSPLSYMFLKLSPTELFLDSVDMGNLTYHCWFDQDYAHQQIGALGNGGILFDVDGLDKGIHSIHIMLEGSAFTSSLSYMFLKLSPTESLLDPVDMSNLTYHCWFDQDHAHQQTGALGNGSFLFDVADLEEGPHSLNIMLEGSAMTSTQTYMFIKIGQEAPLIDPIDMSHLVYHCWFDQDYENRVTDSVSDGIILLDVDNVGDGLHAVHIQLEGEALTSTQSYMFYKKPELQDFSIAKWQYFLNGDLTQLHTTEFSPVIDSLDIITLLPVETWPIRSSCFHFHPNGDAPYLNAKNEVAFRFWSNDDRVLEKSAFYIDYNVQQDIVAEVFERDTTKTFAAPRDNQIQWFKLDAGRGDYLSFQADKACTMQLFAPSGEEVYTASGPESIALEGFNVWEDGTYYLAVHDVTGSGETVSVTYNWIYRYVILAYNVHLVGNGGCSTITFQGNGFNSLLDVYLVNAQNDTIRNIHIEHESNSTTMVTFNFFEVNLGMYDVVFEFWDETIRINGALEVQEPVDILLTSSVSYPAAFLRNTTCTYIYTITNNGNMSAYDTPLTIYVATDSESGISHLSMNGIKLSPLYDYVKDVYDWSDMERKNLMEFSEFMGEDHYFLRSYDADEHLGDSILIRSGIFSLEIPPYSTREITLQLTASESVDVWFSAPDENYPRTGQELRDGEWSSWHPCCWYEDAANVFNWTSMGLSVASGALTIVAASIAGVSIMAAPTGVGFVGGMGVAGTVESLALLTGVGSCFSGIGAELTTAVGNYWCGDARSTGDVAFSYLGIAAGCVPNFGPLFGTARAIIQTGGAAASALAAGQAIYSNNHNPKNPKCKDPNGGKSNAVNSLDPNDIRGYLSESGCNYMRQEIQNVQYEIEFENDTTLATAAAHTIIVRDTLDATKFDLNSLAARSVTIGDKRLDLNGEQTFARTLDLRPELYVIAQVEQDYDPTTGIIQWTIQSLDPMTMEPTDDPNQGVLPVNYYGNGVGFIDYSIDIKEAFADGTAISNRAGIIFDQNEVIMTPTWTNTIDAVKPISHIEEVTFEDDTLNFSFVSSDNRSGVWYHSLYYRNDSTYQEWKVKVPRILENSCMLRFDEYLTTEYLVMAVDSAGNVEDKEMVAEYVHYYDGPGPVAQVSALSQGWNWWSTYVEMNNTDGLATFEESLGRNGSIIKSQNAFVQYGNQVNNSGTWAGTLMAIDNESSYKVKVDETCTSLLSGVVAVPQDHPMTLTSGWNWIGYPVSTPQTVVSALPDFEPASGDVIKGQGSFITYDESYGWIPASFVLNPGKGYLYYSNASVNKTLVFAQSRGTVLPAASKKCYWQANRYAYADNLSMMATVYVDGEELRDDNVELGAFVNGECRGSAKLIYVEASGRYIAFLTVMGKDGEQVEFRLMDQSGAPAIMSADYITFSSNAIVGSLGDPFPIRFGSVFGLTEMKMNVSIYPNPVDCNTPFKLMIPEGEAVAEVLVVDALGEVVSHETGSLTRSMVHGIPTAGVYMLKVTCKSGNVYQGRIVVK